MINYVFGDTGGHAKQLFASLREIGVDMKNYVIPEGVRIIHLGDLIHKGPSGSGVILTRVDKLIRNNPGQWIQILGNHEFQHIDGSPYFWNCECDNRDVAILNAWRTEGLASAAWGLDAFQEMSNLEVSAKPKISIPNTGILFTHAGLTHLWWETYGGSRVKPSELAAKLNRLSVGQITRSGAMLNTGVPTPAAGPVWAVGNSEVFNSWVSHPETDMPFIQFHGHTTSFLFSYGKWRGPHKWMKPFIQASKVNPELRLTVTKLNNNLLIGVDPGYEAVADTLFQPYVTFLS